MERQGAHRFVTEVVEAFREIERFREQAALEAFSSAAPGTNWSEKRQRGSTFDSEATGGNLISMILLFLRLGILPLLGVAWTLTNGMITTVDGLFMSLILLTLSESSCSTLLEMRDSGMIGKRKPCSGG